VKQTTSELTLVFIRMAASELPRIVKFAYSSYLVNEKEKKYTAQCRFCTDKRTIISGKCGTTSNLVKHVKAVHAAR
jgi:hypothetical protein